jgi:ribosomal protein L37E
MSSDRRDWGVRRDDYNTDCPSCGGTGALSKKQSMADYRCQDCGTEYRIHPSTCRLCGEWIAEGAEYCEWHSGTADDGKDDLFVPPNRCLRCGEEPPYGIYELCLNCLEEEGIDHEDWHPAPWEEDASSAEESSDAEGTGRLRQGQRSNVRAEVVSSGKLKNGRRRGRSDEEGESRDEEGDDQGAGDDKDGEGSDEAAAEGDGGEVGDELTGGDDGDFSDEGADEAADEDDAWCEEDEWDGD